MSILSSSEAAEHCRITHDNAKEDAFIIHDVPNKGDQVKFVKNNEDLHECMFKQEFLDAVAGIKKEPQPKAEHKHQHVTAVAEKRDNCIVRDSKRVQAVRKLFSVLGPISNANFKPCTVEGNCHKVPAKGDQPRFGGHASMHDQTNHVQRLQLPGRQE
eukprot:15350070-Ditylum_brightwellii.AAC.1